jgi:hypothetical protein
VLSSHKACSWCLQSQCDGSSCSPPEEPLFYTQTNNAFCEEILPLVKNAKLDLPVDSSEPLSPEQFHFEDSHWGNQCGYPNDSSGQYAYIYDINNDNEFNQQHHPQPLYAEDWGSEWHWSSFNYEAAVPQPMHHPAKQESLQYSETGEGQDFSEGLMLEEDDDDTLYKDGLEQ